MSRKIFRNNYRRLNLFIKQLKYKTMNDVTGVVVKDILQEKLEKYEMYYNYSYQFKDFDMSDFYKKEINRIKSNLSKIKI